MEHVLKKEFDNRLKIWNLKALEANLLRENRKYNSQRAWTIRQVLDLISPNWRKAKDYLDIETNLK